MVVCHGGAGGGPPSRNAVRSPYTKDMLSPHKENNKRQQPRGGGGGKGRSSSSVPSRPGVYEEDEERGRGNNWESLASQGVANRWYAKKVGEPHHHHHHGQTERALQDAGS